MKVNEENMTNRLESVVNPMLCQCHNCVQVTDSYAHDFHFEDVTYV